MATFALTEIVLDGERTSVDDLSLLVERLRREGRKKNVFAVRFTLALDGGLSLDGEATDRGETLVARVGKERRRYVLSVDGVEKALADVVRVEHRGESAALDAYEALLMKRVGR